MKTDHIQGRTYHGRRGAIRNTFWYGVDYVLCDLGAFEAPLLLSHNRFNLWAVHDRHHGGPRGGGAGLVWFRQVLAARGMQTDGLRLMLLTQPSCLGLHFNPVSFWIAMGPVGPVAFVAEVNNTFGDRHCYFCAHPDHRPITPEDELIAEKLMHVSPFQEVKGQYRFRMSLDAENVAIRISYENGKEGVLATLSGARRPASNGSLLWAAVRRPLGAARVLALIHWQAVKLWWKKAPFRKPPPAPEELVSGGNHRREAAE